MDKSAGLRRVPRERFRAPQTTQQELGWRQPLERGGLRFNYGLKHDEGIWQQVDIAPWPARSAHVAVTLPEGAKDSEEEQQKHGDVHKATWALCFLLEMSSFTVRISLSVLAGWCTRESHAVLMLGLGLGSHLTVS
ncbi:hypothetical protein AK812_SmicGene39449 [Symbiodinium microadriaticum]|uniref:Uncharacterized protein n=1 Tax=Symbiodinium microadriaticum TaxID=2951 RepID=A0A1Q9CB66_SYMMI|nr:hypothetical protein AK812_SmicGene39449 [Symbiodinium microadriaticum]